MENINPESNQSTGSAPAQPTTTIQKPDPVVPRPDPKKRLPGLRGKNKRRPKKEPRPRPRDPEQPASSDSPSPERPQLEPGPEQLEQFEIFLKPEFVAPTIAFILNAAFRRTGKPELDKREEAELGKAVALAGNNYLPDFLKKHWPLVNLSVVLGGILMPRMELPLNGPTKQDRVDPGPKGNGKDHLREETNSANLADVLPGQSG